MTTQDYYNEHDPKAAAWLRELIKEGLIAPGIVDETTTGEVLRTLPQEAGQKAVQRHFGNDAALSEQEALRPEVHGGSDGKGEVQQCNRQQNESTPRGEGLLRDLRENGSITRPSQGFRSNQQQPVELDDIMRFLSPSMSLAQLYGDRRTEKGLQILLEACRKKGIVLYPHNKTKEIWASISQEKKNRISLGFNASRWQRVAPFPLKHKAEARVINAICAPVAQAFIEAYLGI